MKILKTKKVNISICWSGLKNTMPKEFPNVGEMDQTMEILEALKEAVPEFVAIIEEGEKLQNDVFSGKVNEEDKKKNREDFNTRANALEDEEGMKEVSIEFEDAEFNTFFQQFERWGRLWFYKLEPYLAFRKDMNATNQQPKKAP